MTGAQGTQATRWRREERRVAAATLAGGVVAFGLLAWWLVPWDPVPGGPLRGVPAAAVFTPAEIERGEDYARWARVWGWGSLAAGLAVVCWLGFGGRGRAWVARWRGPWWVKVPLAAGGLELARRLVTLPFAVASHQHQRDYGLTKQGWVSFAGDLAKAELVAVVVASLAMVGVVGAARRWRRAWPAVAGGLLAGLVLVGSFAYPVLVEPLFNRFTPLPDGPLRSEILTLARAQQLSVDQVLVADASRRTTTLNAYVSGFGDTRRVVVYDTLLDGLPRDEVVSVVAHELGHAQNRDVLTGSALGAAGALAGGGLLSLAVAASGRGRRGGAVVSDPEVVPLLVALVALASLAATPVQSAVSRQLETRADVDALRLTGDGAAFVSLQRRLALRAAADPSPPALSQVWFGTHPTVTQRIALAERLAGADPAR